MGLVQQEWVGQSRGKMPFPRLPIETWGGSCGRQPWERRPAAIQSQSRQDGAPTVATSKLVRFLRPLLVVVRSAPPKCPHGQ